MKVVNKTYFCLLLYLFLTTIVQPYAAAGDEGSASCRYYQQMAKEASVAWYASIETKKQAEAAEQKAKQDLEAKERALKDLNKIIDYFLNETIKARNKAIKFEAKGNSQAARFWNEIADNYNSKWVHFTDLIIQFEQSINALREASTSAAEKANSARSAEKAAENAAWSAINEWLKCLNGGCK